MVNKNGDAGSMHHKYPNPRYLVGNVTANLPKAALVKLELKKDTSTEALNQ